MKKTFSWVVEFTVDESWVADGFDLTQERALGMLAMDLGWAYPSELGARIVRAPFPADIAAAQATV